MRGLVSLARWLLLSPSADFLCTNAVPEVWGTERMHQAPALEDLLANRIARGSALLMILEEDMATHSSALAWIIPMDRGAWWATGHGVAKSQTQLSN